MIATLKMNDGYSIPQLGMGAYLLPDGDECYNSILRIFRLVVFHEETVL